MKPVVLMAFWLWFVAYNTAEGQVKYLPDERPKYAVGVAGGFAKNSDATSHGYGLSAALFKIMEAGISYGSIDGRFADDDGSTNLKVNTLSPYIEFAPLRKENQPIAFAVNISYLTYLKKSIDTRLVTASFSAYRDVPVTANLKWYPEFGISKPVAIDGKNIKPIFSFSSGLVFHTSRQLEIVAVPQIGVQNNNVTRGVTFGVIWSNF